MAAEFLTRVNTTSAQGEKSAFIDLRQWAASVPRQQPAGDAYLTARGALPLDPGPVEVSVVDLSGTGAVEALAADELLMVLDGDLTVTWSNGALRLLPDQCAVIPKGSDFQWACSTPSRVIVMSHASELPGVGEPVMIDEEGERAPSNPPAAEALVGSQPTTHNRVDYLSANKEFMCGVWDATPYQRKPTLRRDYEFIKMIEGGTILGDSTGQEQSFAAGDVMLMIMGGTATWLSDRYVKKVYGTFRSLA